MKKIVGYLAILLMFSWVSTGKAGPIAASITGGNGDLTISGFGTGPNPPTNPTINFLFDFANDPTPGSGTINVIEPIIAGALYHINVDWDIPVMNQSFSAGFDIVSQSSSGTGTQTVNQAIGAFFGAPAFTGNPIGSITVPVNGINNTLNLYSALVGNSSTNPTLSLDTREPAGQTTLESYLKSLDGSLSPPADGSVSAQYTNANLTVYRVPEPTTLLLLVGGLLTMLGFSRKSA